MSREARTLLALGVLAFGALAVLGSMAKRYGSMLESRDGAGAARATERAVELSPETIEHFAAVRRAMAAALAARPAGATPERTLREARDRELEALGLSPERYAEAREAFRRWRIGAPVPDALQAALDARGEALRGGDLGAYESLDR